MALVSFIVFSNCKYLDLFHLNVSLISSSFYHDYSALLVQFQGTRNAFSNHLFTGR